MSDIKELQKKMLNEKNEEKELEEFRKSLEEIDEKDFNGDTCFQDLSVKEKLIWLSELNYFKFIVKNCK